MKKILPRKILAVKQTVAGFTLLEVLIATLVIAIAISGLMSVFLIAAKQTGSTANKGAAAFYQKRILDELRSYIVEDPNNYTSFTGLSNTVFLHNCASTPALFNPHYILQDSNLNVVGNTVHQAIRIDDLPMIPAADVLVSQFGATANYTVEDVEINGNTLKQISVNVVYLEAAP
ncbi:MAG: prepilin-type N-terminal cleavage/methylation domain-containing protein [Elusimicrobiota bacterium]